MLVDQVMILLYDNKGDTMRMGEKLRLLRLSFGLTQDEMASKLGLSRSAYAKYEYAISVLSAEKQEWIAGRLKVSASIFREDFDAYASYNEKKGITDCLTDEQIATLSKQACEMRIVNRIREIRSV